ncbi:MAG: hypothetical protein U5M50_00080 [Sphingobium sp.]|nr:hypothetical protein [Sphingobium sp.]
MPLAALICANKSTRDNVSTLVGTLHFAGHSLLEYQARMAREAGADTILIMVGAVSPDLSRAVDRLTQDGIAVTLTRDIVAIGRELANKDALMLIGDGAVVALPYMRQVAGQPGPAVLTVPDDSPAANMERIDAQARWGGVARLPVPLLADTLDMLGDWDLESTLLRRIVQTGPARVEAPLEAVLDGEIALIDSQRAASVLADAVMTARLSEVVERGPADRFVLGPLAATIAPLLMRQQVPAQQIDIAGIALAAIGILTVQLQLSGIGLFLFLLALLAGRSALRLRRAAGRSDGGHWLPLIAPGIILVGIALIGRNSVNQAVMGWSGGLWLAALLALVEFSLMRDQDGRGQRGASGLSLYATLPSAVLLMLLAQWMGIVAWGMALATAWAIATVGALLLLPRRT